MASKPGYYRIYRENNDNFPLLDQSDDDCKYLFRSHPIENPEVMLFELGDPVPRKPRMVDYHSAPHSVISKKIYDVLHPLNIYGIQLLPAKIQGKKNEEFDNYWAIHIYNKIQCVDSNLSDCIIERISLSKVKKLVLDERALESIPLEKRLVFRLQEDYSFQMYHSSIVDAIMAAKPEGVKFIHIEEWTSKSLFGV